MKQEEEIEKEVSLLCTTQVSSVPSFRIVVGLDSSPEDGPTRCCLEADDDPFPLHVLHQLSECWRYGLLSESQDIGMMWSLRRNGNESTLRMKDSVAPSWM
ncbi:hypothetical protein Bbelb_243090 [Branchiostoma belcheri]|nr:hypothetical protein Bbelb_243090 [Branchiostoma belcheri]